MGSEEKDLTQKFDDWIKKSPDIMALKWLGSQIDELREKLSEIYNGSSLLQKELDIRVDILKTKMKVFRIDKIEKILYDIGKEVMDPEYFDKLIKGYVEIDLDDAQAIGYEKGINKGKKLQKQFDISQIIKKLGYLVKDCDGHSKEYYHNKLIELKEEYQEMTITKKPEPNIMGIPLSVINRNRLTKFEPIENETRIIDCMTNDEFEIQLQNIRTTRLGTAMSSLKGCILRERRLSKKETISKVIEKIEAMRIKFKDDSNYTPMSLMNELWEYKKELEKKLE